jgi:hypothetical protein
MCRIRDNSRWKLQEEKPLSDAARQADVLSDQTAGSEFQGRGTTQS